MYTEVKGRNGQQYEYFLCRARQEGECDLPNLPARHVEEAICRNYHRLRIPDDFADAVREQIEAAVADEQQLSRDLHDQLTKQRAKHEAREQRLIDLAADGVLDRAKIVERSNAIRVERARIEAGLADTSADLVAGAERLQSCLTLVADPARLYASAPDDTRCQLNNTFYQRFYVDDEPLTVARDELNPPFERSTRRRSPTGATGS